MSLGVHPQPWGSLTIKGNSLLCVHVGHPHTIAHVVKGQVLVLVLSCHLWVEGPVWHVSSAGAEPASPYHDTQAAALFSGDGSLTVYLWLVLNSQDISLLLLPGLTSAWVWVSLKWLETAEWSSSSGLLCRGRDLALSLWAASQDSDGVSATLLSMWASV